MSQCSDSNATTSLEPFPIGHRLSSGLLNCSEIILGKSGSPSMNFFCWEGVSNLKGFDNSMFTNQTF